MSLDIYFTDETNEISAAQRDLMLNILEFASDYLKQAGIMEMSLQVVDDAKIQEINRDYRDKDQPTDVISFAIEDSVEEEMPILSWPDDMPRELGDIFISLDTAKAQAKDYNHSLARELGFLALHGFLHLNGYDHMTPEDEAEMFGLQRKILDAYGLTRE